MRKKKPSPNPRRRPGAASGRVAQGAPSVPDGGPEALATSGDRASGAKEVPMPRNHRELAEAIFAECDPVTVGRGLLEASGSERGASIRARVWATLVDFLLGKTAPAGGAAAAPRVNIVWDLPAPPHERGKP